jgi:hypothetical protein
MEAPASITCPDCRARWQRYHDEHGRAIGHTPVGYVKVFLGDASQPLICRSYADVRAIVLPLAEGATVRVQLVAGMIAVGEGCYTRLGCGVAVSYENGACEGLSLALREAIPIDSTLQNVKVGLEARLFTQYSHDG